MRHPKSTFRIVASSVAAGVKDLSKIIASEIYMDVTGSIKGCEPPVNCPKGRCLALEACKATTPK
jgi:hypothetical protein